MNRNDDYEIYEGIVEDIIYYNEENGYVIANIDIYNELICIKGLIPFLKEGDHIRVTGVMEVHNFYGEQLNVKHAEHLKPTEKDEIYNYLSSGIIKGIGESTAGLLVSAFGERTLDVIQYEPEKLLEIAGIGPKKLEQIILSYKEQYELRDFIIYFQNLSISINLAMKIYRKFGQEAIAIVSKNPYILADELVGVGFKQADQLAMRMGIDFHSPYRIGSGILYMLNKEAGNGNTFTYEDHLISSVKLELRVKTEEIESRLTELIVEGDVIRAGDSDGKSIYYLPALYYAEGQVASKLLNIQAEASEIKHTYVERYIEEFESTRGILLAEKQKEAVAESIKSGVFVLTGGPGTGKTTIINAIIGIFESVGKEILLAAPTGRAAKRMTEATQRESKTIHRLLEFQGENQFQKNSDDPLKADVIIIDEISMVDILLMYRFLDAVPTGAHLIFVGDADQLPSVGPGAVLKDLLSCEWIPKVALNEIFRQEETSLIALNAHMINKGEQPILNRSDKDFFFMNRTKAEDIVEEIKALIKDRLPSYYNLNPLEDIQVISPVKGSGVGIDVLNEVLQAVINPMSDKKAEYHNGKRIFRTGDKVMQIKNNYNIEWTTKWAEEGKGVFNGDIGFIKEIDLVDHTMTVLFDLEREAVYDFSALDELTLAYAITVHKSQGSEFKAVIMPMAFIPPMLMSRNILYTAITRARELVVLVGEKRALSQMIQRTHEAKRNSGLSQKLALLSMMIGE